VQIQDILIKEDLTMKKFAVIALAAAGLALAGCATQTPPAPHAAPVVHPHHMNGKLGKLGKLGRR
jgi:hypothetical protein